MNWKAIMIHHSLTADGKVVDTQAIRRYHTEILRWSDIGYHFLIENINGEYEVLLGRPLTRAGAHCPAVNRTAIGICCVGNYDLEPPPENMLHILKKRLILPLSELFGINEILYHRDYSRKTCPGKLFERLEL